MRRCSARLPRGDARGELTYTCLMPYRWTTPPEAPVQELHLWPHQSLPARGMAAFVLATFAMATIPMIALLGSVLLWGLLPFILLAVWGLYFALQRNHRARQITEVLTLDATNATLIRAQPNRAEQSWRCNRHWVTLHRYAKDGPVPDYITLRGEGREVEIGAFLAEEERAALHTELARALAR